MNYGILFSEELQKSAARAISADAIKAFLVKQNRPKDLRAILDPAAKMALPKNLKARRSMWDKLYQNQERTVGLLDRFRLDPGVVRYQNASPAWKSAYRPDPASMQHRWNLGMPTAPSAVEAAPTVLRGAYNPADKEIFDMLRGVKSLNSMKGIDRQKLNQLVGV